MGVSEFAYLRGRSTDSRDTSFPTSSPQTHPAGASDNPRGRLINPANVYPSRSRTPHANSSDTSLLKLVLLGHGTVCQLSLQMTVMWKNGTIAQGAMFALLIQNDSDELDDGTMALTTRKRSDSYP